MHLPRLRHLLLVSALLATPAPAQNPFAAQAPYKGVYEGRHAEADVALRLLATDEHYTGTLKIGSSDYTLRARPTPTQLEGEFFDASGAAAPFVCQVSADGGTLTIERSGGDIRLNRVEVPDEVWGHWQGEGIELLLSQTAGNELVTGMILFQGGKFPLQGRYEVGLLDGAFESEGKPYPFTGHARGETLHFISGPFAKSLTQPDSGVIWEALGAIPRAVAAIETQEEIFAEVMAFHRRTVIDALILQEQFQLQVEEASSRRDGMLWVAVEEAVPAQQTTAAALRQLEADTRAELAQAKLSEATYLRRQDDATEEDKVRAFALTRQAAEWGHLEAMGILSNLYYHGRGVEMDRTQCFEWAKRAAEQGHLVSTVNLAYLYEKGIGVEADEAAAITWYEKAAERGEESSREALERLRGTTGN